jgi:hypothetical protein
LIDKESYHGSKEINKNPTNHVLDNNNTLIDDVTNKETDVLNNDDNYNYNNLHIGMENATIHHNHNNESFTER